MALYKTITKRTNLTSEEIYNGYANGKSRLPKILKAIQAGDSTWAPLADAGGIEILRRRTKRGNGGAANAGVSTSTPIARLVSRARFEALLAGYVGSGVYTTVPSIHYIDKDVRGMVKDPFSLLDMVAGVNYAEQAKSSSGNLSGREAKLQADGSASKIRIEEQVITADTQSFDVRALHNDRIGSGGTTGAVHGVDQGIPDLLNVEGEASLVGTNSAPFDLVADSDLSVNVDSQGVTAITFDANSSADANEAAAQMAASLNTDASARSAVGVQGNKVSLHSRELGTNASIDITEANTSLGFAVGTTVGATVGSAAIGATGQETIELGAASVGKLTRMRYGTYRFGTLRLFNSINDATPVAYIVHPDLMTDLVSNNP